MAVDTTGINSNKINAMQQSIEDWAKAVEAAKITLQAKSVTNAMQGSTQVDNIKKLCQACDSYTTTLTTKLRDYKNRLSDVKTAYAKNDTSSTSISDVTAAIKSLKS